MVTTHVVPHHEVEPMRLAVREPVARLVGSRAVPGVGLLVALVAAVVVGVGLLALTSAPARAHGGLTELPLLLPLTGLVGFPPDRAAAIPRTKAIPRTRH